MSALTRYFKGRLGFLILFDNVLTIQTAKDAAKFSLPAERLLPGDFHSLRHLRRHVIVFPMLTDTNSGIYAEEAAKLGIFVIPTPIIIDGKTYFEGETISHGDFFQRLEEGHPSTPPSRRRSP